MILSILKDGDFTISEVSEILGVTPESICKMLAGKPAENPEVAAATEHLFYRTRFKAAAKSKYGSQSAAAKALGISNPYLTQIIRGERTPSAHLALKIEQELPGIKAYQLLSADRGAK
jgi:plasmid maintenance system antidote protein VapI